MAQSETPPSQVATVGDAARSKVPLSHRLGFWNNSLILAGWVLVLSSFLVGGLVGQAFPLRMSMPIIFFGTLCNGIVGVLIGVAAARTGYSSALLYRYSYGRSGVVLPNVIMGIVNMGWFAVILNITRDGFIEQIGAAPGSFLWIVATVAIGALFILPAVIKIRWLAYIDWFAVPGFMVIFGLVLILTLRSAGGLVALWDKTWTPKVNVLTGFDMAAGGWLVGVTIISDLARFWKNGKHAAIGILSAYAILVTLQYWGGAIGAAHTGDFNIFLITNTLGLGFLAWVALWFGAQSTVQGGVYASGLAFSAPPLPIARNQEFTRRVATILTGLVGFAGSFLGLDKLANWWVGFLAWVVSPIAITVILDYWAFPERRGRYEHARGSDMNLNPAAFVAWAAGFAVGYYTGVTQLFSGLITSTLTAGLIYYGWMRFALARGTTPERQLFK
ncbi:MAG: cytosine permease [Candidatus Latescibacteria bacterium]|nr:cytosine permease [Candidatus Latescibacterota bacterium]